MRRVASITSTWFGVHDMITPHRSYSQKETTPDDLLRNKASEVEEEEAAWGREVGDEERSGGISPPSARSATTTGGALVHPDWRRRLSTALQSHLARKLRQDTSHQAPSSVESSPLFYGRDPNDGFSPPLDEVLSIVDSTHFGEGVGAWSRAAATSTAPAAPPAEDFYEDAGERSGAAATTKHPYSQGAESLRPVNTDVLLVTARVIREQRRRQLEQDLSRQYGPLVGLSKKYNAVSYWLRESGQEEWAAPTTSSKSADYQSMESESRHDRALRRLSEEERDMYEYNYAPEAGGKLDHTAEYRQIEQTLRDGYVPKRASVDRYLVALNIHMEAKYTEDLQANWRETPSGEWRQLSQEEKKAGGGHLREAEASSSMANEDSALLAPLSSSEDVGDEYLMLRRYRNVELETGVHDPTRSAASLHNHAVSEKRRRLKHAKPPFDGKEDPISWPANNWTMPGFVPGRTFKAAPYNSMVSPYVLVQRLNVRPHCVYRYSSDLWGQADPPVPHTDYWLYEPADVSDTVKPIGASFVGNQVLLYVPVDYFFEEGCNHYFQVTQCFLTTQVVPYKCLYSGDNRPFKYLTTFPVVRNVNFTEVTTTKMNFHVQFTQPTLFNITCHVREDNDTDINFWLMQWNMLRVASGLNATTQCEALPPQDLRLFPSEEERPPKDCIWRAFYRLQPDFITLVKTPFIGLLPQSEFEYHFVGHENLRPWEPLVEPEEWPMRTTATDSNPKLKSIALRVFAACAPGTYGWVGSPWDPNVPEVRCPVDILPDHHCALLPFSFKRELLDDLGNPGIHKNGSLQNPEDAKNVVNELQGVTVPVNAYVSNCLNNMDPGPGHQMYFVYDITKVETVSPWSLYTVIDDVSISNDTSYWVQKNLLLDPFEQLMFPNPPSAEILAFPVIYNTVVSNAPSRIKGEIRSLTLNVDSYKERKRLFMKDTVMNHTGWATRSSSVKARAPNITQVPAAVGVYRLLVSSVYFDYWPNRVFTPRTGYTSSDTLPPLDGNCALLVGPDETSDTPHKNFLVENGEDVWIDFCTNAGLRAFDGSKFMFKLGGELAYKNFRQSAADPSQQPPARSALLAADSPLIEIIPDQFQAYEVYQARFHFKASGTGLNVPLSLRVQTGSIYYPKVSFSFTSPFITRRTETSTAVRRLDMGFISPLQEQITNVAVDTDQADPWKAARNQQRLLFFLTLQLLPVSKWNYNQRGWAPPIGGIMKSGVLDGAPTGYTAPQEPTTSTQPATGTTSVPPPAVPNTGPSNSSTASDNATAPSSPRTRSRRDLTMHLPEHCGQASLSSSLRIPCREIDFCPRGSQYWPGCLCGPTAMPPGQNDLTENSVSLSCDARQSAFPYFELRVLVRDFWWGTWNATAVNFDERARMPRFMTLYSIPGIANRVASNSLEYKKYRATLFSSLGRERAGLISASDRFRTGVRPVPPCHVMSPCHVTSDAHDVAWPRPYL